MKKFLVVFSAFMLLLGLSGAAGAYTITYDFVTSGNQFTSPYALLPSFVTENFEDDIANAGNLPGSPWTWLGNAVVLKGDVSGMASAPFGVSTKDTSNYVSIPELNAGSTVANTVAVTNLGGTYNYFGIWWGSVDDYNTLSFYRGGVQVASFTGSQALAPSDANGNQQAPGTNLYVNFLNLPLYDEFRMSSWQSPAAGIPYAFEADNITAGVVPEPTTLLLLGLGLVGLAGIRRKL